jgi:hypothetical protein
MAAALDSTRDRRPAEVVLADDALRQRILKSMSTWCSTRTSSSVTASAIRW